MLVRPTTCVPTLKICGATPPVPSMLSRLIQEQIYLYLYLYEHIKIAEYLTTIQFIPLCLPRVLWIIGTLDSSLDMDELYKSVVRKSYYSNNHHHQ